MHQRGFRWGARLALLLGVAAAASALLTAVVAALALAGTVTYPVTVSAGPLELSTSLSTPVALAAPVCQEARVSEDDARGCFRTFVHPADDLTWGSSSVRRQDADVRPVDAVLHGEASVRTTDGGSAYVAAAAARSVAGLLVLAAILLLVWRILALAHAGDVFGGRTVRHLRTLGWLVVVAALAEPAVDHLTSLTQLGYPVEAFGPGPMLQPFSDGVYPDSIELWQLALGVLSLLLAEVFRHGAELEAEQRLTV